MVSTIVQGLGLMSQLLGICFTSPQQISGDEISEELGDVKHWDISQPLVVTLG